MATHKVIGKYVNGKVELLEETVVSTSKQLKAGDIVELDGDFVRLFDDGRTGLRIHFVTDEVLAAQIQRHTAVIRQGLRSQFSGGQAYKSLHHRLTRQAVAS